MLFRRLHLQIIFSGSSYSVIGGANISSPMGHHHHHHLHHGRNLCKSLTRKYVLLCSLCGGLQIVLGALYLAIYFVLDNHTTSLHYFQTLPTYVPSIPVRNTM